MDTRRLILLAGSTLLLARAVSALWGADTLAIRGIGPQGLKGTLRDTLRIDALLDSAQAWVGQGETERSAAAAGEAYRGLEGLKGAGMPLGMRRIRSAKLEGIAHHYAGRYAPALAAFQRMEQEAEMLGDDTQAAGALIYQSYEYRALNELDRAQALTLRAIGRLQRQPPGPHLANAHAGLGTILFDRGRMDSAMVHRTRAMMLYDSLGLAHHAAMAMQELAEVHMQLEHYDSAMHYLQRARPELEGAENVSERAIFLVQLARSLYALGRSDEAVEVIAQAGALSADADHPEHQYRQDELLALIASQRRDPVEALRRIDAARTAIMEDQDSEKVRALTEVRMQAEHEKEALLAAEQLSTERRQTRYAYLLALLGALVAALLLRSYLVSRRNAHAMSAKHAALVEAQEQLVRSEKQRESERLRTHIARDIHDEMGGELAKIRLLGDEARHLLGSDPAAAALTVDRMARSAQAVGDSMRDIVWATDPRNDTRASLVEHARELATRLLDGTGISARIDMRLVGSDGPVDTARKNHLLRILKEALTNVVRHAGAGEARIRLEAGPEGFDLSVEDDGRGPQGAGRPGGNGLRNMRARAEAIGAEFTSAPGAGVGFRVHVRGGAECLRS